MKAAAKLLLRVILAAWLIFWALGLGVVLALQVEQPYAALLWIANAITAVVVAFDFWIRRGR